MMDNGNESSSVSGDSAYNNEDAMLVDDALLKLKCERGGNVKIVLLIGQDHSCQRATPKEKMGKT